MVSGYEHSDYAQSLASYGNPYQLSASKSWLITRTIAGDSHVDAMGCYPLFACANWKLLLDDLSSIGNEFVSLGLVADPFGDYDVALLSKCFPDVMKPFKEHYVVDLSRVPETFVSAHHRRYARKALRECTIESADNSPDVLEQWVSLYKVLTEKHKIQGVPRFSKNAFALQLQVPGIYIFEAKCDEKTIGMCLWYVQGDIGYYHLGAFSEDGYKRRVSFGLFWRAIEKFADMGIRYLNIGAGAGTVGKKEDGLSAFKRGWSTGTKQAFFCGRIFDKKVYGDLARSSTNVVSQFSPDYFPAYRAGEFV